MEKESAQIKFLIGIALILAALVIGYNAFYIPDAVPFAQISTDGSAPVPSESSEVGEEASPVSINRASAEELDTLPGIGLFPGSGNSGIPGRTWGIFHFRGAHGGARYRGKDICRAKRPNCVELIGREYGNGNS